MWPRHIPVYGRGRTAAPDPSGLAVAAFAGFGYQNNVGCVGQYEGGNVDWPVRSHYWGSCP